MKTKEKLIMVLLSIVIAGISYWFFWDGYYSIDTYRIISQGYTDYALKDAYIRDGRLFLAGIVSLVGIINPSYKVWYIINLAIAIFISAITVLQLYMIINHYKKAKNTKNKCIYFLVSYTFIFNFVQIDTMQFIEAFAIATSILSLKNTVINKNKKMGFIYAVLGMLWYQGTVTIYIATAFLMCLLETKKINKEFFKKILNPAIIIIISAILSSLIVSIVPYITKLELTERFPSLEKYMSILKRNIMQMDDFLIDCCGYFPKYIFISASLLILIVVFVYGIKNKNVTQPINALIVFYVYIVSIFIFFPIQSIELCFRCALSLGAAIPALFIYMICNMEMLEGKKIYLNILTTMVILYFILSVCNTVKVTSEFKFANELDERFVKRIETEAKNLQDKGINIQKYAVYYTTNGDRLNELYNSEMTFYNSYYLLSRDFSNMFGIYGDKNIKLEKQYADKEIVDKYFENPSDEEIQIKYIDDVLYVVVDL